MGRTQRRRRNKPNQSNLDHEQSTIELRKWLRQNKFTDPLQLRLCNFPLTGRGVTSSLPVKAGDILIRVPLDLLITFNTVLRSGLLSNLTKGTKIKMQTLMAFYLAVEKHKNDKSQWVKYIDSLPCPAPVLPWMCPEEMYALFPPDLQVMAKKLRQGFEEALSNLQQCLDPKAICQCCKKPLNSVLERDLFKWAYILINTRAVYIDPMYILSKNNPDISILSDEPSMALCPFLDMFNHHYLAETKVGVVSVQGQTFYELRTLKSYAKYEQFFISYGAHDNEKLFMEYGFFIPGNTFDCVKFSFEDVLNVLKLTLGDRQYKFIKNHDMDKDIYISAEGVSFNLKAIFFVSCYPNVLNYNFVVFSDLYPGEFEGIVLKFAERLLKFKLGIFEQDLDRWRCCNGRGRESEVMLLDFLTYRIEFVKKLLELKYL